ncbi:hypothetical protein KFE25_010670 [Diacronema lutheri]|uniref:Spermidine synthase n=2 Tax=Diacronema lutheri TaxID=2081491 RepID=A0A8J5XB87_DIALT|nr:hypothetical protein KFE25_010670 [Diacronema lutheri]
MARTVVWEEAFALGAVAFVIDEAAAENDDGVRRLYLLEPPSSHMLVQTEVGLRAGGEPAPRELRFAFHRAMLAALVDFGLAAGGPPRAEPERLLCLGLGGGALASWLALALPRAAVHVAEVHAELVPIASRLFGMPHPRRAAGAGVHVHVSDAHALLLASPPALTAAPFDAIFVDVNAPAHDVFLAAPGSAFVSRHCLEAMRARCCGVVVLNVLVARLAAHSGVVSALVALLEDVFSAVWAWPPRADAHRALGEQPLAALTGEANCLLFCDCAAAEAGAAGLAGQIVREHAAAALASAPAEHVSSFMAVRAIAQGARAAAAVASASDADPPR